jgi:flagellar hook-length control protein FliK
VPVTAAPPVAPVNVQPASPAAPVTEVTAPAPVQVPDMHQQLGPRITRLLTSGNGQHQITVRVDPEEFGPVRVVANISGDDVSVVLHASNEQGREALKVALADLRRDLEATGLRGSLDLATASGNGGDRRPGAERLARPMPSSRVSDVPMADETARPRATAGTALLDMLV